MFCERFATKITHVHKFHASNVMWTRTVTLALGKLLSSSWCFLKIYTADKNFTRPLVAPVAPNINSELVTFTRFLSKGQLFNAFIWCDHMTCSQLPTHAKLLQVFISKGLRSVLERLHIVTSFKHCMYCNMWFSSAGKLFWIWKRLQRAKIHPSDWKL